MITVGIDEVGRGSWAGPLVAAAVVLDGSIAGLKDSKKLSRIQRQRLSNSVANKASAIGIGWVSSNEIDNLGLTLAVGKAMRRALDQIKLNIDEIIIDGNYNYLSDNTKSKCLVSADVLIDCVSAASIIAKVARDKYMVEIDKKYPNYGFAKHVGYGTMLHRQQLKIHGLSKLHRLSFKPMQLM
ncbi:MAG TPA: ribonuclease HII [Candidatus Saccharimonadales bacterium]|nr:ribonuclease HII [Candidatus Saccharimonadales bacterium]